MKEKRTMLKRAMVALCRAAVCWLPASAEVLAGDVDGNGKVNIADVTELIDLLLNNQTDVDLYPAADADGDGVIGIADVVCLIDVILNTVYVDHEWVDLGLPSGTLWATCNVGADSPEEYGDYFAWGETEPKDYYDWSTYKWCNGNQNTLTKYCDNSAFGYNGFRDNKTELEPEDDAAYVNWGPSWRIPSLEQIKELSNNCTSVWTTQNGVNGQLVTGPNGNTLFLPAAGDRWDGSLYYAGVEGTYWSRTFRPSDPYSGPFSAYTLYFDNSGLGWVDYARPDGYTVRAVRVSPN